MSRLTLGAEVVHVRHGAEIARGTVDATDVLGVTAIGQRWYSDGDPRDEDGAWYGSLVLVSAWDSLPMYLDQRKQREQREAREARMAGGPPRERAPRGGEPLRAWAHRQVGAMTDDQLRRLVRHIGRMR